MKLLLSGLLLSVTLLIGCTTTPQYNDPIPAHDSFTLQSEQVGELRVINVWTPPEYKTTTDSLPVLYMPDGGIKEDFPHIANRLVAALYQ